VRDMASRNDLKLSLILSMFLFSCTQPAVDGQSRHFGGLKEYLPYTRDLPAVEKVELLKLTQKDDHWNGEISNTKTFKGAEARKIASLWRRQTYNSSAAACHEPAYGIKFYAHGKLIAYASICWSCNNMFFLTPKSTRTQSFEGYNKKGEQLSEVFRLAFEPSDKFADR
jgi:hypothetical protein